MTLVYRGDNEATVRATLSAVFLAVPAVTLALSTVAGVVLRVRARQRSGITAGR